MMAAPKMMKSKWLVDSGSTYDIINPKSIPVGTVIDESLATEVQTASGTQRTQGVAKVWVEELQAHLSCHVMPDTPNLISMGRKCADDGWIFRWEPPSKPHFVTQDQRKIELFSSCRVPCIYLHLPTHADPAMAAACEGGVPRDLVPDQVIDDRSSSDSDEGSPKAAAGPAPSASAELAVAEPPAPDAPVEAGGELIAEEEEAVVLSEKARAKTKEHLLTHLPKNNHCSACMRGKMIDTHKRAKKGEALGPLPTKFGEQITCDHLIARSAQAQGAEGERNMLVVKDRATGYIDCFPVMSKRADEVSRSLVSFLGRVKPGMIYTDCAPELAKAIEKIAQHGTARPYRHETNGVIERAIQLVTNGARANLAQAGLPSRYWTYACRHFCFSYNVRTVEGISPWFRRYKKHFDKEQFRLVRWCIITLLNRNGRKCQSSNPGVKLVSC
jgi:hypothetical protein